ncbi:MAG: hypothetical protein MJ091_01495 [Clostridia bacterium]|nr:hypothetical protein [Clostridia bacterium]
MTHTAEKHLIGENHPLGDFQGHRSGIGGDRVQSESNAFERAAFPPKIVFFMPKNIEKIA